MSEIRGLKKTDIKDGIITINSTMININGEHIEKDSTKTIDSTRQIKAHSYIISLVNALPEEQEYITTLSDHALYMRFTRLLERKGVKHMSFHDLRHMNASIMLMLGIPDKYAMERGGWSSDNIMKSVYQHTFSAGREAADRKIDEYFSSVLDTLADTDAEKEDIP